MMKKFNIIAIIVAIAAIISQPVSAQKKFAIYAGGFYNLENLFDTIHDNGKNDYEYLPNGNNKWNSTKYTHKLANMAHTLAEMGTDVLPDVGCAFIGVSEVENSNALNDLVMQSPLAQRGIKFCHIEGPDARGIDCALLYNPKLFSVRNVKLVPYIYEKTEDSLKATRGFLTVSGTIANEHVTVVVCHLPSRYSPSYYREQGGNQLKRLKDSLVADDPNVKIFIMGDMNDDPFDKSMSTCLGAHREMKDVEVGGLYNPWWNTLVRDGNGTLYYKGAWNLFDQIIMSNNLLDVKGKKKYKGLTFYKHSIFKRDYLIQSEGKYKGAPLRTSAGGVWLDGYSDHLPVVVYLIKETK
jgi:hypothetical protein